MKRQTLKKTLILLTIAALLTFIWTNSMYSREESSAQSESLLALIEPVLRWICGEQADLSHAIRKLAHFTEFAALGCAAALVPVIWGAKRLTPRIVCAFGIMAAALTDETIQIFSRRGSQVSDVWLDFAGGVFGLAAMTVLLFLLQRKKNRRGC